MMFKGLEWHTHMYVCMRVCTHVCTYVWVCTRAVGLMSPACSLLAPARGQVQGEERQETGLVQGPFPQHLTLPLPG